MILIFFYSKRTGLIIREKFKCVFVAHVNIYSVMCVIINMSAACICCRFVCLRAFACRFLRHDGLNLNSSMTAAFVLLHISLNYF